ncbi:hypothetical protein [Rufibacter sp. LB8]|uniref:hypothetical protein n=1 Tax=Rufibacter sp. LB8 TaxID=2777781 RepID=UPI00178C4DEF|nr:hypothetical protein [Rufibacter sp. LB8]
MKKIFYSLVLVTLVGAASAFTLSSTPSRQSIQRFQFQGSTLEEALDSTNWQQVDINDPAPGCFNGELPCYVETEMSISQWLSGKDEESVALEADARRN